MLKNWSGCSCGCGFVSKRDRRDYFRFVPMQFAEGRPLVEQLGINPDRPDFLCVRGERMKGNQYTGKTQVVPTP